MVGVLADLAQHRVVEVDVVLVELAVAVVVVGRQRRYEVEVSRSQFVSAPSEGHVGITLFNPVNPAETAADRTEVPVAVMFYISQIEEGEIEGGHGGS